MKKLNCAFYTVPPTMKRYLRGKMRDHKLTIYDGQLDSENLDPNTEVLGVFVDSKVDKKIFKSLKKLKLVVTTSTGYDHVDLKEAKKRKIPVCNVPAYGENTVAQYALTFVLSLTRKFYRSIKRVKNGFYNYDGLEGIDLKDKTIGIIGTGHIGMHLVDMLEGFDSNIIGYDKFPNRQLEKEHNFSYTSLDKLLKTSDIISLHVPLFPETYHMISKKEIKKMKKGVYIINTARGGLIDPEALLWGLNNGHVAGAGLDVLEEEDLIAHQEKLLEKNITSEQLKMTQVNEMIVEHENTIVTPHNAFNSAGALKRIISTTADNIKSYTAGEAQNDVTKPRKK
ncbi:MAG: hydroxyacid dehydrogenase [Candidatus Magasanikbacteria bacterium]|jgi:D-lactate dehydrogenase|nr:hydroxyacid dehydrogenase [Candidatus Magasanikbacteria bacterium]MBT4315151.1 hydroxyacid dehydrogenase [Candidatus Magasanikbacteria bacterium]MBT4547393.1 hydroxyacid dehydrogenase [Candidatus Magasanikbacteria bacterium]MBT6819474.1 hydroxyacid dehydrogenase [Candidatus Magasanikbacteria bacterium]